MPTRSTDPTPAAAATLRGRLSALLDHPTFERLILGLIVVNAITLGLETSGSIRAAIGPFLEKLDHVILAIFVAELIARMALRGWRFWRDPWSVFDFAVVAIAVLPATENLSVLRSLRILRALRLVTAVPSLRRVVGGLLAAVPSMGSIIFLLMLINYVYAVMATKLFGADFPQHFETLGASFFTFFQMMTLEGWSGEIVRPVMEKYPWAWAFFVPYIVIATFMVLNLFIGIVVDAMQSQADETSEKVIEVTKTEYHHLIEEIGQLRAELRSIRTGAAPSDQPPR